MDSSPRSLTEVRTSLQPKNIPPGIVEYQISQKTCLGYCIYKSCYDFQYLSRHDVVDQSGLLGIPEVVGRLIMGKILSQI